MGGGGGEVTTSDAYFWIWTLRPQNITCREDSRLPKREMGFVADSKFTQ